MSRWLWCVRLSKRELSNVWSPCYFSLISREANTGSENKTRRFEQLIVSNGFVDLTDSPQWLIKSALYVNVALCTVLWHGDCVWANLFECSCNSHSYTVGKYCFVITLGKILINKIYSLTTMRFQMKFFVHIVKVDVIIVILCVVTFQLYYHNYTRADNYVFPCHNFFGELRSTRNLKMLLGESFCGFCLRLYVWISCFRD